jgi:hypothetical protein
MDPRWIVVVLANLLLVFLGNQINHHLAVFPVSVFLIGMALPIAGLRLRYPHGLAAMFLSGLLADAGRPVPFGSTALILSALFTIWHSIRTRLPREGAAPAVVGALLANLILFLAQPVLLHLPMRSHELWHRAVIDLLASQLFVALLADWFLALQEQALLLVGVDLAEEARQPGGNR